MFGMGTETGLDLSIGSTIWVFRFQGDCEPKRGVGLRRASSTRHHLSTKLFTAAKLKVTVVENVLAWTEARV